MQTVLSLLFLMSWASLSSCSTCSCGWTNPTRIVGGKETGVNEYPMMAGIIDLKGQYISCGATIISQKQVITAASCVYNKDLSKIAVIVGDHDVTTGEETDASKVFSVIKIIVHPDFDRETMSSDMALIIVDSLFGFNQLVGPACLPFLHSRDSFEKKQVQLLGWGLLNFGGDQATVLQKIKARVVAKDECEELNKNVTDWSKQLCVLGNDKTTCLSDSGGPILWRDPETKRMVLAGIIGYNPSCDPEAPSIDVKVGAFIDWIESQTLEDNSYCKLE